MAAFIRDRRKNSGRGDLPQRRRHPRLRLSLEGFFEGPERVMLARVVDINLRGAMLATPAPERAGAQATLRLALPGEPEMLRLQVEVRWALEEAGRGPLGMGVRFLGLVPAQLERIAALLLAAGGADAFPRRGQARSA